MISIWYYMNIFLADCQNSEIPMLIDFVKKAEVEPGPIEVHIESKC